MGWGRKCRRRGKGRQEEGGGGGDVVDEGAGEDARNGGAGGNVGDEGGTYLAATFSTSS